jgi:DNA-binding CsgD family transcriptional regulator
VADLVPGIAEPDGDLKHAAIEALVRQLVSDIAGDGPVAAREGGQADRVILDVQVDGVRCLLTRLPKAQIPLSPRELQIARMVAKGYPNKTIAAILDISTWTVASHLRRIFSTCGVSSRASMVAQLLEGTWLTD